MAKLLVLLVCLAFVKAGTSLTCYVCGSLNGKSNHCMDPFDKKSLVPEVCDIPKAVCLKEKVPATDGYWDNVLRGCVVPNYCEETEDKPSHCSTCEADNCNSSSALTPSIIMPAIFLITARHYF